MRFSSRSRGGGVARRRVRYARVRPTSSSSDIFVSGIGKLLPQLRHRSTEVAARGAGTEAEEDRTFVDGEAVVVVERDHRSLSRREMLVGAVQVHEPLSEVRELKRTFLEARAAG